MRATVVIRAKNEAAAIGRTLELVAGQTVDAQVVVVDSGSTDDTVAIARGAGAEVIEIPAKSFTYGGSLNTGTEAARAELVVALSAHAFPVHDRWLEAMLEPFGDDRVACTTSNDYAPEGGPLRETIVQDEAHARRHPMWGYSNAAGAFRAALWREKPFRADMPGTEDKEWAWHWLTRGMTLVVSPEMRVDHTHGKDPARELYERSRREWYGLGMYFDLDPYPMRAAVREWWSGLEGRPSHARARISHRRAARIAGRWTAQRSLSRRS
jgi:glycosyltransferase involved in cell wall biosynthesis